MKTDWKNPEIKELGRRSIVEMRCWLQDCDWANVESEDFEDMSPLVIARGVSRHFEGGVCAFIAVLG